MNISNKKDPKLAVGYIRTKTGRGRMKMTEQFTRITTKAQELGCKVDHCYIEVGSRDQYFLKKLLDAVDMNDWGTLIIHDRSRLSEDEVIYRQIESELKQKGVEIVSVIPEPINGSTNK